MKKWMLVFLALFLLTGCAGPAAGQAPSESRPTVEASALWQELT